MTKFRTLSAVIIASTWSFTGAAVAQNVDMNKITQQDIDAVSTTTHNMMAPNNAVMSPGANKPAVNQPSEPTSAVTPDDTNIVTIILAKIAEDPSFAASSIQAACHNGDVVLSGTAKSMAQISRATNLAKSISGVKTVTSRITIK